MRLHSIALFTLFLLLSNLSIGQHAIIPQPVSYEAGSGQFLLTHSSKFFISENDAFELSSVTNWFRSTLNKIGFSTDNKVTNYIVLSLLKGNEKLFSDEGYRLHVNSNEIKLSANTPAGIFYGMQSLLQMLPVQATGGVAAIPACTITDYPRFGWRGLMLDVSRHFFTVDEVKTYLDLMAQYKLNVFHWHLTDDQGWRIEIKSLPKLTEVGACRVERFGTFGERIPPRPDEKATDCGFYTQEQIKEIVAYAQERFITIVPEIDVPGHSLAAIASYPELSITKEKQMVSPGHKFSEWYGDGTFKMLLDNTLNPIDENVYTFLDKVFGEVAALFPGTYIHAGGDEAYHGYWERSKEVQAFMKKNGIKDMHGMQSYFMKRVASIIESKGKKMIGWDEILDGGLAKGAAVMSWRGMKGGIEAAKQGHPVVMSPTTHAYLDYMQGDPSLEPRVYAKLYLKTCFDFDPVPQGIDPKLILGGQGNLWTEKVPNLRHATYMTYPRAWALAEAVWSPVSAKSWEQFMHRVQVHFDRADAAGITVSKAVYDPIVRTEVKGKDTLLHLSCEYPGAVIHYTLDGSHPNAYSPVYQQPVLLQDGPIQLRTTTTWEGKPLGRTIFLTREELLKRK
jgi:hexosaminidase